MFIIPENLYERVLISTLGLTQLKVFPVSQHVAERFAPKAAAAHVAGAGFRSAVFLCFRLSRIHCHRPRCPLSLHPGVRSPRPGAGRRPRRHTSLLGFSFCD